MFPLYIAEAAKYFPFLGSQAHITFQVLKSSLDNSESINYFSFPIGEILLKRKWSLGKGIKLVANFLKSEFS